MKYKSNEIRKLQKIAGILKEDAFETQNEPLPENWVLIFNYSDGQITPSTSGRSAEQVAIKIKEGDIKQGFPEEDIKFTKNANDFYTVETNEYHITDVIGSKASNAEKIKELYELGIVNDDYDILQTAFDLLESMKKSKPKVPKFSLDAFSLNEDDFDLSDNPLSRSIDRELDNYLNSIFKDAEIDPNKEIYYFFRGGYASDKPRLAENLDFLRLKLRKKIKELFKRNGLTYEDIQDELDEILTYDTEPDETTNRGDNYLDTEKFTFKVTIDYNPDLFIFEIWQ